MASRPYCLPFTPVLRVEVLCLQEIVIYLHVTCRLLSLYMWFTVDVELFFFWFIASLFICSKRAVACSKHAICRAAQSQIFKKNTFTIYSMHPFLVGGFKGFGSILVR